MTNEIRFGGNHRKQVEMVNSLDQGWAGKLGIPNVSAATFPFFNIATTGYGLSNLSNRHAGGDDFVLQDNMTKVAGKHTLKFGYEVTRTWYNSTLSDNQSGIYNFDAAGTASPLLGDRGDVLVDEQHRPTPFASFSPGRAHRAPGYAELCELAAALVVPSVVCAG